MVNSGVFCGLIPGSRRVSYKSLPSSCLPVGSSLLLYLSPLFATLTRTSRKSQLLVPLSSFFSTKQFHSLHSLFILKKISPVFATLTKNEGGTLPPLLPPLKCYFNARRTLATVPLTPLDSAFTQTARAKSFRICTDEKKVGVGAYG
jgi:hypothetical protein